MTDENQQNQTAVAAIIPIENGINLRIKNIRIVADIVDGDGNALTKDGVTQSSDSIIELSAFELEGLALPTAKIAEKIYG